MFDSLLEVLSHSGFLDQRVEEILQETEPGNLSKKGRVNMQETKDPEKPVPTCGKFPQVKDSLGRPKYEHKYKFGKPDQEIPESDLTKALAAKHGFVDPLLHGSYLAITFWIGSRKTEALEIFKEDIHQEGESLFIKIPAKKHGRRGGEIELPLSWPGVDLIKEQLLKTRKERKIWPISPSTAYRIVKRIWPEKSPHHLRYRVITKLRRLRDQQKISTDDIKSYTGIRRDSTIEGYGLKTQAGIHKISNILKERPGEIDR